MRFLLLSLQTNHGFSDSRNLSYFNADWKRSSPKYFSNEAALFRSVAILRWPRPKHRIKPREFATERERDEAVRVALPVLQQPQFSQPLVWRLVVVILVPIQIGDHVGVLLNRSRLPKIRSDRALVRPLFDFSVKLG